MLNILLISASTSRYDRVTWAKGFSSAPLGLLYLASTARLHGHRVMCLDQLVENMTRRSFQQLLAEFKPDVVGLSVYTESVAEALEVAGMARRAGATVVAGGAHATFVTADCLLSGLADYVVRYEGEATFIELLTYLEYGAPAREEIRGLAYRDEAGEVRINKNRPRIENLDGLPFPALADVRVRAYTCPLVCLTSRGCPGRCLFCLSPPMHGARYRSHSTNRVVAEVYTLARRHPGLAVAIIDDTFTRDPLRVRRFCAEIGELLPGLPWSCYSRVDALDEDLIKIMADVNCVGIQLGIEAGDQEVADSIGKRISLERAEEIVRIIYEHGIMPLCSLMIGHHTDTRETIRRTLEYGRRLTEKYRALVTFAACAPFPGAPVFRNCRRLGVELHAKNWSEFLMTQPFISTAYLSREELREAWFEASEAMGLGSDLQAYWRQVLLKRVGQFEGLAGIK
jgi:anaerobic magnesium-protoporphyrin IX monomethyl ester cyclase